jgi:hypothetical protein
LEQGHELSNVGGATSSSGDPPENPPKMDLFTDLSPFRPLPSAPALVIPIAKALRQVQFTGMAVGNGRGRSVE